MLRLAALVLVLTLGVSELFGFADTFDLDVLDIGSIEVQEFTVHVQPNPPRQVSATALEDVISAARFALVTKGGIHLSWLANHPDEGVTEYRVYRARGDDGDFDPIGATNGTAYADGDVEDGETYVYYVTAVNDVGESPPSDEASAEVPVNCEALRGSDDYDAAADAGDCPPLEEEEAAEEGQADALDAEGGEAEPGASETPAPTDTPQPTPTSTPFPTRAPSTATPVTTPTATAAPTDTPEPTPTAQATAEPTATQEPTAEPSTTP